MNVLVVLALLLVPLSSPVARGELDGPDVRVPVLVAPTLADRTVTVPGPSRTVGCAGPTAKAGRPMVASWYGDKFHGRTTASGEVYDQWAMTAAHKTLPFGTRLRVTGPCGTVEVTVNDRGPFTPGRDLDLSRAAFATVAPLTAGVVRVYVEPAG